MDNELVYKSIPLSPFPGIKAFNYSERNVFFSREREIRSLIRLVVIHRGTLLYSESGKGKSSLINAGLIPEAIQEGFQPERIRVQPRKNEEIIIERLKDASDDQSALLPSLFFTDDSNDRVVLSVAEFEKKVRCAGEDVYPLLIFDQFEEWVTLFEGPLKEESGACQKSILDAISSIILADTLRVKVLISLREDYLAKLSPLFERCPHLPDHHLRLGPIESNRVVTIIRSPFKKYPGAFSPEIDDSLASHIEHEFSMRHDEAGLQLSEIQIVCGHLYENGVTTDKLRAFYDGQGGVKGILESHLEHTLGLLPENQRDPAIALLSRMVTRAGTRNVISRFDLLRAVEVEDEIASDLLTTTLDSLEEGAKLVRREHRRKVYYYEIVSEFLIDWILQKSLNREEQRKLLKANEEIERQRKLAYEQTRIARRMRNLTIGLAAAFVIAVLAGVFALRKTIEAKRQAAIARCNELISHAFNTTQNDPELSLLLALEAHTTVSSPKGINPGNVSNLLKNAFHNALNVNKILKVLSGHSFPIQAIAYQPQGKLIATGDYGGIVKLWDASNGKEIRTINQNNNGITDIVFSSDGGTMVTASQNGSMVLWNMSTMTEQKTIIAHTDAINAVAVSSDGTYLATASDDSTAAIWNASQGKQLLTLHGHVKEVNDVVFSPDGKYVVTAGSDMTVRFWSPRSGEELNTLCHHKSELSSIAFSPNGQHLASADYSGLVMVYNLLEGRITQTFTGHTSAVLDVVFHPEGDRIGTVSYDGSGRIVDISSGKEEKYFRSKNALFCLAFARDGNDVAVGGLNGIIKMYKISEDEPGPFGIGLHTDDVNAVCFSPDGRIVATASDDGSARMIDADTREEIASLKMNDYQIDDCAFSPDGRSFVTVGTKGLMVLWDTETRQPIDTLIGHQGRVKCVTFSPDGKYAASGASDKTVKVWNISSGKSLMTLTEHHGDVCDIAFSPDGKQLVSASQDCAIRIWNFPSGGKDTILVGHALGVNSVKFSPDGSKLLSSSKDKRCALWNLSTGNVIMYLTGHTNIVLAATFSPDGKYIASGSMDRTLRLWDAATGILLRTYPPFKHSISDVTFQPDGKVLVASGENGSIHFLPLLLDDYVNMAKQSITRELTHKECQQYLRSDSCLTATF